MMLLFPAWPYFVENKYYKTDVFYCIFGVLVSSPKIHFSVRNIFFLHFLGYYMWFMITTVSRSRRLFSCCNARLLTSLLMICGRQIARNWTQVYKMWDVMQQNIYKARVNNLDSLNSDWLNSVADCSKTLLIQLLASGGSNCQLVFAHILRKLKTFIFSKLNLFIDV